MSDTPKSRTRINSLYFDSETRKQKKQKLKIKIKSFLKKYKIYFIILAGIIFIICIPLFPSLIPLLIPFFTLFMF